MEATFEERINWIVDDVKRWEGGETWRQGRRGQVSQRYPRLSRFPLPAHARPRSSTYLTDTLPLYYVHYLHIHSSLSAQLSLFFQHTAAAIHHPAPNTPRADAPLSELI
ncbi:hypothetical protein RB213_007419 [Colletotrichum asianum]